MAGYPQVIQMGTDQLVSGGDVNNPTYESVNIEQLSSVVFASEFSSLQAAVDHGESIDSPAVIVDEAVDIDSTVTVPYGMALKGLNPKPPGGGAGTRIRATSSMSAMVKRDSAKQQM